MVSGTDKARYSGSVANDIPGLIFEYHFDKDIAWEDLPLNAFGLSLFYGHLFLNGNKDTENPVFHAHRRYTLIEVCLDLILIA